jgi:lantibiotic biosynthesis protein
VSALIQVPHAAAGAAAAALAHTLAVSRPASSEQPWRAQSLAKGAAGIALVHIERAHAGLDGWGTAHAWLTAAAGSGISAADDARLYYGAPALAFALHAATTGRSRRYGRATAVLDRHVAALAHRRADQAAARIDRGESPGLAEFDLIYGLSGIGAHLLRHAPGSEALERILSYLVRLTEPLRIDGETLPGWWTGHDPRFTTSPEFPGGHGNLGMAHGISGPLALLALAMRWDISVEGERDAIDRICAWLDAWRQEHEAGLWWPQWITRDDQRTGRVTQPGPLRPSWCYGTPGIARAQQLAGIATGDLQRQHMAEQALAGCLSDPAQLGRIIDTSLCHGWAGLFQSVWRSARDAATPTITARLPHLADLLLQHTVPSSGEEPGLLEGDAGLALALHTAATDAPPLSQWDACLLLS